MFRDAVRSHYADRGYHVRENVKVRGRSGVVQGCDMIAQGVLGNLIISFGDASGFEAAEVAALRRKARDVGATAVIACEDPPTHVRAAANEHGVKLLGWEQLLERAEPVATVDAPVVEHPWPEQETVKRMEARAERVQVEKAAQAATGLWRYPRVVKEEPEPEIIVEREPFAWLKPKAAGASPAARQDLVVEPAAITRGRREPDGLYLVLDSDEILTPDQRSGTRRIEAPSVLREAPSRTAAPRPGRSKWHPASWRIPWEDVWKPAVFGIVTAVFLFLFVILFV